MTNFAGSMTPDGCPVELYALLPAGAAPQLIHEAIPAEASILELGAGAGRITHPLMKLGHKVVAVDESAAMLAHIKGAETIESRIEDLDLKRKFDVVLLMSHLIEKPDIGQARAFLKTCRSHVSHEGQVLIQRDPPDRDYTAEPPFRRVVAEGCTISMRDLNRIGPDLLSFTIEYQIGDSVWRQSVINRRLDDKSLKRELYTTGMELAGFLTPNRSWIQARPIGSIRS
ncbi:class I SAM-dependent methyltransferase [Salinispora tropica]|uniref:class I SAM-dependent methyltransferase n=1 Tax=Salinispora tropica TaxID=168695 RepID=UPI0009B87AB6|nr:class I SAM-dependent methyltransferase [Salinispora tropica]